MFLGSYHAPMPPKHDITQYRPMLDDDARKTLRILLGIEIHRLPQLKGAGKANRQRAADAVDNLAGTLFDALIRANVIFMQGPREPDHKGGVFPGRPGYRLDEP